MSTRTPTPDLMSQLLGSKPAAVATQTERQKAAETEERKIKATHYLTESTLYRLEQALTGLRMATDNRKLTRYELVEEALRMALEEWESAGPESQLAQRLRGR